MSAEKWPVTDKGLPIWDEKRAQLEEWLPGWRIWYVPNLDRDPTWCAQPWPHINCDSPEQLVEEIKDAHQEAACEWNALAGIADYAHHARIIKRAESR